MTSQVPSYYKKVALIGSALTLALAVFLILFFSMTFGTEKIALDPIDSASCIACHTDETIIAQSTFEMAVGESSGG